MTHGSETQQTFQQFAKRCCRSGNPSLGTMGALLALERRTDTALIVPPAASNVEVTDQITKDYDANTLFGLVL
jgi:hypothetical protein